MPQVLTMPQRLIFLSSSLKKFRIKSITPFMDRLGRAFGSKSGSLLFYGISFDSNRESFVFLMEYGIDISVIVKNEEHFKYWLGALPFYDNVEKEGVIISG